MKQNNYEGLFQLLVNRKKTFTILKKRTAKTVSTKDSKWTFRKKSILNTDRLLWKEAMSLFGQVAKSANRYIIKMNFAIPEIKQKNSPVFVNRELFKTMGDGEIFSYVDINHCYWRIAFIQGLISKSLYEKVLKNNNLKTYRNMSLALLIAPTIKEYYIRGCKKCTITEDKSLHSTIYSNIRFLSWNLLGEIREKIGDDYIIAHRTDAILCKPEVAKKVGNIITKNNMSFKIIECAKIDEKHYQYGDKDSKLL